MLWGVRGEECVGGCSECRGESPRARFSEPWSWYGAGATSESFTGVARKDQASGRVVLNDCIEVKRKMQTTQEGLHGGREAAMFGGFRADDSPFLSAGVCCRLEP
jgi:hypothetical protein